VADDVDELFVVAPEDFVAARNALAKSLRTAGQRDVAAQVAGLRRPTVADWALNVAAHEHSDVATKLIDAAARLREIQSGAIEGRGGDVRGAITAMRTASGAVHRLADEVLSRAGRDRAAQAAAISARLGEIAANPGVAEQLRAGRLGSAAVDEVDPFSGLEPAPVSKREKPAKAAPKPASREPRPDPAVRRTLEKTANDARRGLAAATKVVERAEARVEAARAALSSAEDQLEEARREEADASSEVGTADEALARHDAS
jgi:hypothetical protein